MKKIIIIAAAFIGFTSAANAQSNASGAASQTVQLSLSNALEITFTGNNSANGSTVTLPFTTVNDYANGVESNDQEIKVRSNKDFTVTVKTSAATFNVTNGATTSASTMPASVLGVVVSANTTGGSLGTGFSATAYKALSSNAATIISQGDRGGNQNQGQKQQQNQNQARPSSPPPPPSSPREGGQES